MKVNIKFPFIRLAWRQSKWNVHHEGGKRKGRCAGNGREKSSGKQNILEKQEEQEANNFYILKCKQDKEK